MGTGTINSKRRYLDSLKIKHRELDKSIIEKLNTASDELLKQLKVKRLNLKTKINQLENQIHG
tara:strand:+ start:1037 stop:1225 length:189 start_codon:yes stop_codon:yes gene_type:complete